ncbi:hypothetical protein M5689_021791 [Euphorbia peplus]|nr:hypothetical protein M5689_021791 [Euphorbia peplus]
MDDAAEEMMRAKKINPHRSTTINGVIGRIFVSLLTMLLLIWAIRSGFQLATHPATTHVKHANWAFRVGVLTMLLGFMFLLLGIPILADLVLNLSHLLQEDAEIHKEKKLSVTMVSRTVKMIGVTLTYKNQDSEFRIT